MKGTPIGSYAFLGGAVLAILLGIPGVSSMIPANLATMVLVVLGLVVGVLNIPAKETHEFLLAAIALLGTNIVAWDKFPAVGGLVSAVLGNVGAFVAPAAVVVALTTIWRLAKD